MSESVFVRWYGKVVEGEIINQHDMFGMVAVSIPIQGVRATTLYQPHHVYNTMAEAQKPVDRLVEVWRQECPSVIVAASIDRTIEQQKQVNKVSEDYLAIQQFKEEHWDHEHNRLQLDYWKEFEQLWHDYIAKRLGMMCPQPQQQTEMKQEYPKTDNEAMNMILSTGNPDPTAFINEWVEVKEPLAPKTIGKPYTVTELTLF